MIKNDALTNRFVRGVGINLLGNAISIILNFAGLIIAVRVMPKEQFGVFTLISVISLFFIMISDCGMESTIVRFVAAEKDKQRRIIETSLAGRLMIAALVSVLIFALRAVIMKIFRSEVLADSIIFIPIIFFLRYLFIALECFLLGLHLYKHVAVTKIVVSSIRLTLVVLFVLFFKWELIGMLYAFIISWIIACGLAYFFLPWRVLPKIDSEILKKMFSFGVPLQVNKVLAFIFDRIDTLMLGAMLNPLSVAVYEVGYKIPEGLRRVFNSFRQVYFSHMSEFLGSGEKERADMLLNASLRFTSFFMSFATLIAGLFYKQAITFIFSEKYAESGIVLVILMVGLTLGMCNHLIANMLVAAGRPKKILVPGIAESILNVCGNLICIPLWGIVGAAIASLISRTSANPIFLLLVERKQRAAIGWAYFRSFIALILSLAIFHLAGWNSLSYKFLTILIFIMLGAAMRIFSKEELLSMVNIIGGAKEKLK